MLNSRWKVSTLWLFSVSVWASQQCRPNLDVFNNSHQIIVVLMKCVHREKKQPTCCVWCQDVLKDLVSTSCGHWFCRRCITSYWDQSASPGDSSCPQCGGKTQNNSWTVDRQSETNWTKSHWTSQHVKDTLWRNSHVVWFGAPTVSECNTTVVKTIPGV